MNEKYRKSITVALTALLSGTFAFGVLSTDVLGKTPAIFWECKAIDPCPDENICRGIVDNWPCIMCELTRTQKDCIFAPIDSCNDSAPAPPDENDCGEKYQAFCLTQLCDFDPIIDKIGTCTRSWCA